MSVHGKLSCGEAETVAGSGIFQLLPAVQPVPDLHNSPHPSFAWVIYAEAELH